MRVGGGGPGRRGQARFHRTAILKRVAAENKPRYDTDILDTLAQRVVVGYDAVDEIRSAAIWLDWLTTDMADKIRELALEGSATAERVGSSWASRRRVAT